MLTEGRVRAIAAQVASAIAAKIKPSVSEEQIRSIQLQDNGDGNFVIATTSGATVNLADDGEGNYRLEVI